MEMEQRERRLTIAKGFRALSSRSKLSITGENIGIWGYLGNVLEKSNILPNQPKGIVTCSNDEYMQLHMKDKIRKSVHSQLPEIERPSKDLNINISSYLSPSVEFSKSIDQCQDSIISHSTEEGLALGPQSEMEFDQLDLKLDGQKMHLETDLKASPQSKADMAKDQVQNAHHNSKRKQQKKEKAVSEIVQDDELQNTPQVIYEATQILTKGAGISEGKYGDKKSITEGSHNLETNILKISDIAKIKENIHNLLVSKGKSHRLVSDRDSSLKSAGTSSSLLVANKDKRLLKSSGNTGDLKLKPLKSSHEGMFQKQSGDSEKVPTSTNSFGSRRTLHGPTESRRGSQMPVAPEGTRGSRRGSRIHAVSVSRRGSQMPVAPESTRGSRRGSQIHVASDSRRGSFMPSLASSSTEPTSNDNLNRRKSLKGDNTTKNYWNGNSLNVQTGEISTRKSFRYQQVLDGAVEETQGKEVFEEISVPPEPVVPPLGPEKVKLLWQWAFYCVLGTNKLHNIGGPRKKMTAADRNDSDVRWSIYEMTEIEWLIKLKNIFSKKQGMISDDDLASVNSILGKVPFFSKFPQDVRMRLYKELFFATYPKGKKLIKEALPAEICYILLVGETIEHSEIKCARTSEFGSCIGGFLSSTTIEPRNYSAICLMQTTVLCLPKSIWIKFTREAISLEAYQVEALSTLNIFKNLPKSELVKLCAKGSIQKILPTTFINIGATTDLLYFIIKGKVQIMYLLEFVKVADPFVERKFMISAFNGQINNGDELVKEIVPISDLGPGNFFPPLVAIPNIQKSDVFPWRYLSGDTIVETFVIPKTDFLESLSATTIISELENAKFFPTRESLVLAQDRYLYLHGWCGAINNVKLSERIAAEFLKRNLTFENFSKYGS